MIKERRFNVHPEVLTSLAHLRLKTELGIRASETTVDKPDDLKMGKTKAAARRAKGKETGQPHLSKKAKKALKERKEIEKEMNEAVAEVDKEERAANVSVPHACDTCHRKLISSANCVANRNAQAPLRAVLPNPQEPSSDSALAGCTARHSQIRPPGQH